MTTKELRQKYLDFFKSKDHAIIPSASLIPENDPTVLFTTAGMHPLVPYLMGEPHPQGRRLASVQKCVRTTDIEDVGDNRHLTFFEMLGNWSIGDYFKKEAIEWSWEFLTSPDWLGLDPGRLYVTVFMGNENSPLDEKSIAVWQDRFKKAGLKAEVCGYNERIGGNADCRIFPLPARDNWWGPAGDTGPCGPCTEMFYDVSPEKGPMQRTFDEEVDYGRIMEIWNDVFMEFNKTGPEKFEKLPKQHVDTGMGLERTVAVLTGKSDAFAIPEFKIIFDKIGNLSGKRYGESEAATRAMRIIADHIKAAAFIMGDNRGIGPSNVDQGYIVRRLVRRAIRYGRQLEIKRELWTKKISEVIIDEYSDIYPELESNRDFIMSQLDLEEAKFKKTLERGLKAFKEIKPKNNTIQGLDAFNLYQTYGFPIEMTTELALEKSWEVDEESFKYELKQHQELSRAGSAGKFKGGLADAGEQSKKYHTATHLLNSALRQVLGEHVEQRGSNITAERLRFDFSHPRKLSDEEKQKVEDLVNRAIDAKLPVICEEMDIKEAKKKKAIGIFDAKYDDIVKVYTIGNNNKTVSCEICGGPHVANTGELGYFKIKKEESSGAGVRRIKAILE